MRGPRRLAAILSAVAVGAGLAGADAWAAGFTVTITSGPSGTVDSTSATLKNHTCWRPRVGDLLESDNYGG